MTPRSNGSSVRDPALNNEAADWFERVHRPDVNTATLESWQRWMASSGRHRDAFRALEDLWRAAGDVTAELRWPTAQELAEDQDNPDAPSGASPGAPTNTVTAAVSAPPAIATVIDRRGNRPHRAWRLAAGIAVLAISAVATWLSWNPTGDLDHAVVRTQAKEHRELVLPDGSRVVVGARTRVTFDYTTTSRGIAIDSGEAFFEVKRDPARPFIVRAGAASITAVGTAFNVKHVEGRVAVTVVSGIVDVRSVSAPASLPDESVRKFRTDDETTVEPPRMLARVRAGEAIVYGPELAEARVTAARGAFAWQHGRLEYLDDALKYVVPDVSRYTRRHIVITDSEVGEMRFTGTVVEGNVDAWLATLPEVFPVEVVWSGDDTVLLRIRASGAATRTP